MSIEFRLKSKFLNLNHKAPGVPELRIPPYQWWSEGLHGTMEPCVGEEGRDGVKCPTSFPCPSALATSFNKTLWKAIGTAIGIEGRAISNLRTHDMEVGDGLTYWSPNINLQRDPRWGRNQEAPGEDPHLTSQYAKAFVTGLQTWTGDCSIKPYRQIQVAAMCKHFLANSLERWGGFTRHDFDAHISDDDLWNYYLPPFQECTKHALGVMCSYNAINGQPACTHKLLLRDILRQQFNFSGYLTSDCWALKDIVHGHHAAVSAAQAAAMAMNATVDLNCGGGEYYPKGLLEAYRQGWVQSSTIRESFIRLVRIQMQLGLFDAFKATKRDECLRKDSDWDLIDSTRHRQLAIEAAQQSMILLKNDNSILPLTPGLHTLALIGPHFDAREALLSNYHGERCPGTVSNCIESPFEAIEKVNNVPGTNATTTGIRGCSVSDDDDLDIEAAIKLASRSDIVILFVGLNQTQEREELDRNETTLPGHQQETQFLSCSMEELFHWEKKYQKRYLPSWHHSMVANQRPRQSRTFCLVASTLPRNWPPPCIHRRLSMRCQ